MCVIAVYEAGLKLHEEELRNCFDYNNDGAGLMYWDKEKGKTRIRKGFFTFEDFWQAANEIPEDVHRVFHFRIATSGAIAPSTCHPFAVSDGYKTMGKANTFTDVGMVHNGILSEYTPKLGMKSKHSDTMQFIKEMAYPLGKAIWNKQVQELLAEHTRGNKLVFVGNNGSVAMLGEFTESKESGAWYSNTSYKRYKSYYTGKYTDYSTYGYDDVWYSDEYAEDYTGYYDTQQAVKTYEELLQREYPECVKGVVDTITDDGEAKKYYPVEVFVGKMSDDCMEQLVDDMYDLAYQYYVSIYDYMIKDYSIVFWVDYPTAIVGKKINGAQTIYAGDKDYTGGK